MVGKITRFDKPESFFRSKPLGVPELSHVICRVLVGTPKVANEANSVAMGAPGDSKTL